jgi:hypothetical protein
MSLIQSGKIFTDGEQLTAAKLNQIIGDSTISTTGVDGSTIIVNENNTLAVRTGSIGSSSLANNSVITNKLPDSTDDTDGVTLAKIQHIETNKVIGRVSASNGVAQQITLNTDDAMASAGTASLATDGSIKAYVDNSSTDGFAPSSYTGGESVTLPNGLIMKFGVVTGVTTQTSLDITFVDEFPNQILNVQTTATNTSGDASANGDFWYQIKDTSQTDKITIYLQQASANTSISNNVHWLVIGY